MTRTGTNDPKIGIRLSLPFSYVERLREIAVNKNTPLQDVVREHFTSTLSLLFVENRVMPNMYVDNANPVFRQILSIVSRCTTVLYNEPRFKQCINIDIVDKEVKDGDSRTNPESIRASQPVADNRGAPSTPQ